MPLPGVGDQAVPAVGQAGVVFHIGTLQTVLSKLTMDNSLLLKAKREPDISVQVALYSNPM